jgi:hypothetical protein
VRLEYHACKFKRRPQLESSETSCLGLEVVVVLQRLQMTVLEFSCKWLGVRDVVKIVKQKRTTTEPMLPVELTQRRFSLTKVYTVQLT